jgi:iron complex transport system ATP-binding protein
MGIELIGIRHAYAGRLVLDDVSLRIPAGCFGVILGRNGSGKSTLLRIAAGLLRPEWGEVRIGGKDILPLSVPARAGLVGYLAQFHQPVFSFSVRDVVLTGRAAGISAVPGRADEEAADEALAQLGIADLAPRPYDELSGGERQLVMIARVLAQRPQAILLDEPVSHLDLANQIRLLQTLHQLTRQGITLLAALHDPNQAFLFADEIVYLDRGRFERHEEGAAHLDADRVGRLYGVPLTAAEVNGVTVVLPVLPPRGQP